MFFLINMPHYSIEAPSLPLALFKALFRQKALSSKVLDLNILLAGRIGMTRYNFIQKRIQFTELVNGLWGLYVWGPSFHGVTEKWLDCCQDVFKRESDSVIDLSWLREFRDVHIPGFLSVCLERVLAEPCPSVVGFSCYSPQVLPALALGRLIRKKRPEIKLVYGGAAFHGEMGDEYIRKINWIDAVSTGEADDIVVRLFCDLAEGRDLQGLQGILYRDKSGIVKYGSAYHPVSQKIFAALPDPDFDDFFESAVQEGISTDSQWRKNVLIPFEGSRGCWWGIKSQCTFCGLNGRSMIYRSKSGKQIYKTLLTYIKKHHFFRYLATDTVMNREHFETLLPKLAASPFQKQLRLCGEIRADISRDQAISLAQAGFEYLQCGIENLSTRILQLLRKGTRGLQNVYFLKLCRQYGITPVWYFLHQVPGERLESYRECVRLIPKIVHLHPPRFDFAYPLVLYRFSPYFKEKTKFRSMHPKRYYAYQYPVDKINLSRIAYMYDTQWLDTLETDDYKDINTCIKSWYQDWMNGCEIPRLVIKSEQGSGAMEIEDTRLKRNPRRWLLEPNQAAVIKILDDPNSINTIMQELAKGVFYTLSKSEVDGLLRELIEKELVIKERKTYLSLVLPFQRPMAKKMP